MSFIEGVGDEVIAFAVILLVFILAATITFLLNSSPFSGSGQVSQTSTNADHQNQNHEQRDNEESSQDNSHVTAADSNHTSASNVSEGEEMHSVTEEAETVGMSDDNEVCSKNSVNSHIYPDVNECVSPSAPDIESEETEVEAEEREPRNPEEIHVRLKYLDDTERTVTSHPTAKIGDFKRTHFAEDIANNKVVRLIFSGQLLQDNATLQSYAVANNCVIHVQILQAQTQQNPSSVSQNTDLDLSHLLWPLLSVILGLCWIMYFKYPEFFNVMSLGFLFMFTGSLMYIYNQVQHQE